MARVTELEEMLAAPAEISAEEMEAHLALVGKEAAFVECLAGELEAGRLRPAELPALLENLAARLSRLAQPAAPWVHRIAPLPIETPGWGKRHGSADIGRG